MRAAGSGTASADKGPATLGMVAGTSPSGKTRPLPGSNDTMARTFVFFIAASPPGPPACECVNRMPGPMRLNSADVASAMTPAS